MPALASRRRLRAWLFATVVPAIAAAQPARPAASAGTTANAVPAAIAAIREADLKRDLYAFASDTMRGREAGTLDELRASMWLADQLRHIGVAPAGTDGSYFQWWNMRRTRLSTASSRVQVAGRPLTLWTDVAPSNLSTTPVDATTIVLADARDTTTDVRGKVVVTDLAPPPNTVRREGTNSYEYRYATAAVAAAGARLQRRGAAAVISHRRLRRRTRLPRRRRHPVARHLRCRRRRAALRENQTAPNAASARAPTTPPDSGAARPPRAREHAPRPRANASSSP